jgi:parallel beta-helix repeat protein
MRTPSMRHVPRPRHDAAVHHPGRRRASAAAAFAVLVGGLLPAVAGPAATDAATCPSSLQGLIDGASSGATITVPACTFHESVSIRKPITLHATGATVDGDNTRTTGVIVYADGVTIDGLTVTRVHQSDSHVGAINVQAADRFTFSNGVARDSSSVCLALHGATNARILDSELTGCGKEGYFLNNVADSLFRGNRIHHNNMNLAADWFVEAGGGKTMASRRVTFDGNEVAWNRGPGIWFDVGSQDVTVTGNHVHDNDREGIFFEVSSGAVISGNAVWDNGFGFATWGWGAGISISSSDGAKVSGNTVAWNARGISVISQARQLSPHDHNTVSGNTVVSGSGSRVAGWYDDHGGSLYAAANANTGHDNRYWVGTAEPSDLRFEWNGGHRTLAAYNGTPGEEGATYLSTTDRNAALGAAGIPLEDGTALPRPAPRAGDPRVRIGGSTLGSWGVPVTFSWSSIGVADAYAFSVRRDAGSWTALSLARRTSLSKTATLATGHTWRGRLRLHTPPSTWSPWATTAAFVAARAEETSGLVTYGPGTWRRIASGGALGGSVRYATSANAAATIRFTGRAVAWVSPVGPTRGSAKVYLDGAYRTTISLHRTSFAARRLVYRASWSVSGTHVLKIVAVGTAGHARIDVDAFAILR